MDNFEKKSLEYHSHPRPGKLETNPIKNCKTQEDLSFAYTPGVAYPSMEISRNHEKSFTYTNRGNLVGVISNGSAVLGLGDIGAAASKPVMEGKGVLFKRFAGIDVYDIEINENDPDKFIETVIKMESTFGGINLEDIKAPECFYIEDVLKKKMDIPVFHDDQHGTAVIVGAGVLNALKINGKKIDEIKIVFSGAGAAGIACANFIVELGANKKNIFMFDKYGPLNKNRRDLCSEQIFYSNNHYESIEKAMNNADLFIGVSAGNIVSEKMIKSMNKNPIIFALANPTPEISYYKAKKARDDAICATGRSDFPNQVNNVLGFPFIFRGALDVRAKKISDKMKIAAAQALAELARKPVPEYINNIYNTNLEFGPDYIIPKAFDHRILIYESFAVAKTALRENNFRKNIDLTKYQKNLEKLSEDLIQI